MAEKEGEIRQTKQETEGTQEEETEETKKPIVETQTTKPKQGKEEVQKQESQEEQIVTEKELPKKKPAYLEEPAYVSEAEAEGLENEEEFDYEQDKNRSRNKEIDPNKVTTRVYVGNLPYEVRWQDLKDFFRKAGNVAFAEVLLTPDGRSKGCGIVEFETKEEAMNAIQMLNDTEFGHRLIFVREDRESESPRNGYGRYRSPPFISRGGNRGSGRGRGGFWGDSRGGRGGARDRGNGRQPTLGRKLFIGNLPWSTTWQDLKDAFSQCGSIVRADIIYNQEGRSKGQGIILFDNAEDARVAIDHFNNSNFQGRMIMVREDIYY